MVSCQSPPLRKKFIAVLLLNPRLPEIAGDIFLAFVSLKHKGSCSDFIELSTRQVCRRLLPSPQASDKHSNTIQRMPLRMRRTLCLQLLCFWLSLLGLTAKKPAKLCTGEDWGVLFAGHWLSWWRGHVSHHRGSASSPSCSSHGCQGQASVGSSTSGSSTPKGNS